MCAMVPPVTMPQRDRRLQSQQQRHLGLMADRAAKLAADAEARGDMDSASRWHAAAAFLRDVEVPLPFDAQASSS